MYGASGLIVPFFRDIIMAKDNTLKEMLWYFPLTISKIQDYRPVRQNAARRSEYRDRYDPKLPRLALIIIIIMKFGRRWRLRRDGNLKLRTREIQK